MNKLTVKFAKKRIQNNDEDFDYVVARSQQHTLNKQEKNPFYESLSYKTLKQMIKERNIFAQGHEIRAILVNRLQAKTAGLPVMMNYAPKEVPPLTLINCPSSAISVHPNFAEISETNWFSKIPRDIVVKLMKFLPYADQLSLSKTCKRIYLSGMICIASEAKEMMLQMSIQYKKALKKSFDCVSQLIEKTTFTPLARAYLAYKGDPFYCIPNLLGFDRNYSEMLLDHINLDGSFVENKRNLTDGQKYVKFHRLISIIEDFGSVNQTRDFCLQFREVKKLQYIREREVYDKLAKNYVDAVNTNSRLNGIC